MRIPLQADVEGRLLRRYKRFFADIETTAGETLTVHCPNPGSMKGLLREGAAVRCSTSDNPARKLRHTWEMIRIGRVWVGLHTTRANELVARLLAGHGIPGLEGYTEQRREVAVPSGSRLDFRLAGHPDDPRPVWIEVKSVTLAEGACARFPDSVTTRGRRHAETLAGLHAAGDRAVLLFVVQRADCERVETADEIDPAYGEALRTAARAGVEVLAVAARVTPTGIRYEGPLPVTL